MVRGVNNLGNPRYSHLNSQCFDDSTGVKSSVGNATYKNTCVQASGWFWDVWWRKWVDDGQGGK